MKLLDLEKVKFIEAKEEFKQRLHHSGFKGNLYSDQNYFANRKAYFGESYNSAIEKRNLENVHLVVFVHGLEGELTVLLILCCFRYM